MDSMNFNYKIDKILSVKVVDIYGKETFLTINPEEEQFARLPVGNEKDVQDPRKLAK